jgi:hypothetical protein
MYPQRELSELAERKRLLQARIEVRRWECAAAAEELSRPIAVVDRGIELWKKISPFVKFIGLPMTFLGARKVLHHAGRGKLSKLLGLLPVVLRTARTVMQMRAARDGATAGARG